MAAPRFDNGVAWDPICQMLYRDILSADPDFGDPLEGNEFLTIASGSKVDDHLPRYLRKILKLRPDVAQAYDDGRNQNGFLTWLTNDGPPQLGVGMDMLRHLGIRAGYVKGVNYVGYFRSHLGIAEASRNAVVALKSAKIDVSLHDISSLAMSPTGTYGVDLGVSSNARYRTTILGVNADETPRTIANLPTNLHSTFLIGCWAWETSEFPEEWCNRFDFVDEVWVASKYVAEAVRAKATVPVFVVPYAVSVPAVEPDKHWLTQICPDVALDEFIFICFFDVASIPFRKNPHGTIDAFKRAFRAHEPVRLIVKVLNGERDPDLLKSLIDDNTTYRVTVWDTPLDSLDRFRLLASTDAFVSLHRAEGFGLVIAEAMALGRPVIVTDWSGNADFTDFQNAALVSYDLIKGKQPYGPYPAGTVWAEPNLDDAARQMRRVWEDPDWRGKIGTAAAKTIVTKFAPEVIGATMKLRLERLSASTRNDTKMRERSMQPAVSLVPNITFVTAFRLVSRDALRRPLFFAARAPRMLRLLFREGGNAVLGRVALYVPDREIVGPKISLRKIVLGFLSLFNMARLRKTDGHKAEAQNIVRQNDHDYS
jgi:glycosyltransferase involved in cell wall biosynthesis